MPDAASSITLLYRPSPDGCQRIGNPMVSSPEDVVAELLGAEVDLVLVGDGAVGARDRFLADVPRARMADDAAMHPSASTLARLATPLMRSGVAYDAGRGRAALSAPS